MILWLMWKLYQKTCKFNFLSPHKLYSLPTRVYNFPPKCTIFPLRCLCLYWCWCWWLWTPCQEEMLLLCGGEMPEEEWEVVEKYRWHQTRHHNMDFRLQTSCIFAKNYLLFQVLLLSLGWISNIGRQIGKLHWNRKFSQNCEIFLCF